MGKTARPVNYIKADIKRLEAELKQAEKRESSKNEWYERMKLHTEQDEVRPPSSVNVWSVELGLQALLKIAAAEQRREDESCT
jgi:hypothetical protein